MATGKVKWFNEAKGYGFIAPEEGGKDVFVHATALASSGLTTLRDGQSVTYEAEVGAKGPQATSVSVED